MDEEGDSPRRPGLRRDRGGAHFIVAATKNIVSALGVSNLIGGLFITTPVAMLPQAFTTWSVTKSGQVTSGITSVIADHAVTMTLGFFPLAMVALQVQNFRLFWVNLAFVAVVPALYAASIHLGGREHGFKLWQALALLGVLLAYLAVMLFWVLGVV